MAVVVVMTPVDKVIKLLVVGTLFKGVKLWMQYAHFVSNLLSNVLHT